MKSTRRKTLIGAVRAAMMAAMPRARADTAKRMTATTRILEVNGKPARVFALIGPDRRPSITSSPGERFTVRLENRTGVRTLVHWHGQLPDRRQDGFPWPQTPPIAAGANQRYDYAPIAGTYWMHSHHELQEQQLMTAPLIVHDVATPTADAHEVVMLLHDFSFKSPDELLAGLTHKDRSASRDTTGVNADDMAPATSPGRMNMGSMNMGGAHMGGMVAAADLNDVDFDAFLANDRTLDDPQVVRAAVSARVRPARLASAAASAYRAAAT